jgi:hypothetical protein
MDEIPRWTVFESRLTSTVEYANPLWDVGGWVDFSAPSGKQLSVRPFWIGARDWGVRFCPDETGVWRWIARCSDSRNHGLNGISGTFECVEYEGDNPLYVHGSLKVAEGSHHLMFADGTPFLWLGDTAWNGVMLARGEDWNQYLQQRRRQRFSAIQFASMDGCLTRTNRSGKKASFATDPLRINPKFFQELDSKVEAVNRHGMLAVPVIFWTYHKDDPGRRLAEDDAICLGRYVVARWGAYQCVWCLAGDGIYDGENGERWKRIGREIFSERHDRPVTMHPQSLRWVKAIFEDEEWYDFVGYQSGHGDSDEYLAWLINGPPAREWASKPVLPIINLEANYEEHPAYHSGLPFSDYDVRVAAYRSLLVSPTAGVTYGHMAIWAWKEARTKAPCYDVGLVPPWRDGLNAPGLRSLSNLQKFFGAIPWWKLRPAPELVAESAQQQDVRACLTASMADDRAAAVVYLPKGGTIRAQLGRLKRPLRSRWFNPVSGEWSEASIRSAEIVQEIISPSSQQDWVLYLSTEDS